MLARLIGKFIVLLLVQVLILNHLNISLYLNPYVYPLIILSFAVSIPHWMLLLLAFFIGLLMDAFSNSFGMHAAVLTMLAFARPAILSVVTPVNGYAADHQPTIGSYGLSWFLSYAGLSLLLYHLAFFMLEIFGFEQFFFTLKRTVVSAAFALLLTVLIEYLFHTPKRAYRP